MASQDTSGEGDAQDRAARIRRIVEGAMHRGEAAESVSAERLIADHPDLMPELGEALAALAMIREARQRADVPSDESFRDPDKTEDADPYLPAHSVRCPGSRLGKFLLEAELGRGGQGEVWQAFDTAGTLGQVALKIPDPLRSAKSGEAWLRNEVGPLRKLTEHPHPNIVPIHDAGVIEGVAFVAFELVKGLPLETHVLQHKLSARQVAVLLADLSDAVAHAHRYGVVHRDIKPGNVIVTRDGGAVLADFGLARWVDPYRHALPSERSGTPRFVAPEQARAAVDTDHRVDVFALGATLRYLLMGQGPYCGDVDEQWRQASTGQVRMIDVHDADLPTRLTKICNRAMSPGPADRHSSASELARDLRRWANRRRRLVGGLAIAAVAALLLGLAWEFAQEPEPAPPGTPPAGQPDGFGPLRVHFQRADERGVYHRLDGERLPLRTGDRVQFHVDLNEPMFVYLLALQSDGSAEPLYGASPDASPERHVSIPPGQDEWLPLSDPAGAVTVVLLAGKERMQAAGLAGELASLAPPPKLDPASLYVLHDGRTESIGRHERNIATTAVVRSTKGLLDKVHDRFGERFELVYAVVFPQVPAEPASASRPGGEGK